jgi:ParB-like chromosome segregation protein Spo0J
MRKQKNGAPGTPKVDALEQKPSNKSSQADIKLLPFHPLADMFPLLEGQDFADLVADIRENGLRQEEDIDVDVAGRIIDGRNRYLACIEAGVEPRFYTRRFREEAALAAFIISKNVHRRHLTAEQKRDLIAKLLIADPTKSDRAIAKIAKASPTTVGTVRAKGEASGDVSKSDTRRDTKGRKQPARKASKPKPKDPLVINPVSLRSGASVEPTGSTAGLGDDKPPVEAEIVQQPSASKPEPEKDWKVEMHETTALIDFAKFTIANIESGHLKISGDPERYRKWCDLKDRVAPLVKV